MTVYLVKSSTICRLLVNWGAALFVKKHLCYLLWGTFVELIFYYDHTLNTLYLGLEGSSIAE